MAPFQVADFSQALANLHDKFGHELQMLVETFRKRNGELRKERLHCPNSLFQVWELFLQQVEVNSQQHGDISRNFSQSIGNGLIERVFHRKIQSKKIFAHRDRIETILIKSNELLLKCYNDYCHAYALAVTNPAQYMSEYIGSHNVYVHQLQATNGMIHAYQTKTLPRLLEELEECHLDTSQSISSSLLESSELVSEKSTEQVSGYQMIASACRQANHKQDIAQVVKIASSKQQSGSSSNAACSSGNELSSPDVRPDADGNVGAGNHLSGANDKSSSSSSAAAANAATNPIRYHQFQAPSLQNCNMTATAELCGQQFDPKNLQLVPTFKNEIAPDLSQPPAQQQPQLEKDRESLEEKIERFEERIESLNKLLIRSSESKLHNKVNELMDELCQRRFDLLVAQIHLSAVRSQLQLFEYNYRPANHLASAGSQFSQLFAASASAKDQAADHHHHHHYASDHHHHHHPLGYRNKWIKALKSLKETPTPSGSAHQGFSDEGAGSREQLQQMHAGSQQLQQEQQTQQQQQQQQENQHFFQEYTFKKIASCDVCKDFLRGHMRQGVKCKLCKISCHNDCQTKAHATIKCQQPKIKLLRRQKSAGELEVNNMDPDSSEPSERTMTSSSKPDGIYQLIRQVLDAKKKGNNMAAQQHQMQQQQQQQLDTDHLRVYGTLGHNAMMNLSTGNLALANQSGKSVSTSALGNASSSAATVDRWAVVMDLLAQSRKKDKGDSGGDLGAGDPSLRSGGGGGSKQRLDKFKLAAKSAAAASKSQRGAAHFGGQQLGSSSGGGGSSPTGTVVGGGHQELGAVNSSPLAQQHYGSQSAQQQHQSPMGGHLSVPDGGGGVSYSSGHHQVPEGSAGQQQQHQQQSMLLQHTKSLPVGKLPANVSGLATGVQQQQRQPQQQQQLSNLVPGGCQQLPTVANIAHQPLTDVTAMMQSIGAGTGGPTGVHLHQQHHGHPATQPMSTYQLLETSGIGVGSQQQLQSTSAPHSPQRKRFNLRMKSFSLDSPESPSVLGVGGGTGAAGAHPSQTSYPVHSSGGNLHDLQLHHHQQAIYSQQQEQQLYSQQKQQQQQQQQHHVYLNHQTGGNNHYQRHEYHLPHGAQYQPYADPSLSDRQLSAYLSASTTRGANRLSSTATANQPQYQHRHSYHNPSYQYTQQRQPANLVAAANGGHSSSQSALNSIHLAACEQQGPQAQQVAGADLVCKASGVAAAGAAALQDSSGLKGQTKARNDYYDRTGQAPAVPGHQQPTGASPHSGTFVVLYDYLAQRGDEIQLSAGQLVMVLDTSERDWWEVSALDAPNRIGYFPASYLAPLYQNERPLQVAQTIQVSNGDSCHKLLRGQIVIHAGKQMDNFVTIRLIASDASDHYIECPEKFLMEVGARD